MKDYKLVKEDDEKFHVEHPKLGQFSIAKNAVGPEVHRRIKALKMADGGEVPDIEADSSTAPTDADVVNSAIASAPPGPDEYGNILSNYKKIGVGGISGGPETRAESDYNQLLALRNSDPEGLSVSESGRLKELEGIAAGAPAPAMPQAATSTPTLPQADTQRQAIEQQTAQAAAAQQAQAAAGAQQGNLSPNGLLPDAYAQAFAQKQSGISGMAGAQAQAGKEQAEVYAQQAKQIEQTQQNYQAEHAKIDSEHKQLIDGIVNEKVDPNRLWNNMGTGNKIGAAIAVILGGIGGGLSGRGGNAAMDVIQKSIERDIESQKLELGKKNTLLSENMRRYGDLNTATQQTMLQMNAMTQAQVSQIAARTNSAQAQGQAKIMLGDLGLQAAQIKQQMAVAQTNAKSIGLGGQEGGIPVGQEPYQMLSDPKYQSKRVLVNGRAYQFGGKEEAAQDFKNVESVAGGVTDLVKQLDQLGPSATVPGTAENNKAQALRYQLSTEIPKLKSMQIGAKRVNETEAERAEHMISDPTKFSQLVNGGVRNDVFFKTLNDELERARQQNLLGYKGVQQYKSFKPGA